MKVVGVVDACTLVFFLVINKFPEDLIRPFQYLKGTYNKDREGLFTPRA